MYIVGKAIELKDKVVGKISEMWDSVTGFFSTLKTNITTSFTEAKDSVISSASSMVASVIAKISAFKTSFINYFKGMKDDAVSYITNMVTDIQEWFSESKLGKAFAWVGEKTQQVSGFFLDMWEKVTRHSYVPDMVGEIGQAFAKLKASMVDPAEEATSDVAESFEEMADDSISSLEKLWKFTSGIGSKIGGFAKGFGSEMISSLAGGVFGGISAGVEGFRASAEKYRKYDEEGNPEEGMTASMLGGGIAGFVMGLAQQSEQFQSLVEKLQPIMDMVIDLFGRLVEPLLPLVDVLGNMLQPLLKALEPLIDVVGEMLFDMIRMLMQFIPPLIAILTPILQLVVWTLETIVMPVMKFIYKALATMYNTIANAINSLISGINKVPFINIRWRMPTMNENLPEYQKPAESSYDVDEEEAKSYSGGTQVSEITGPTRDLFVNLLSPLASLNSLTSIGNRIYDLLDERLGSPLGVNIGEINIYGDADVNAEALADELEEILAGRMAFAMGGNA
jgi:phage-related protein